MQSALTSRRFLLPLVALLALAGCSSRAWYEGLRAQQRQSCMGLPPEQYNACMEQANTSYDSYQQQRKALQQPN